MSMIGYNDIKDIPDNEMSGFIVKLDRLSSSSHFRKAKELLKFRGELIEEINSRTIVIERYTFNYDRENMDLSENVKFYKRERLDNNVFRYSEIDDYANDEDNGYGDDIREFPEYSLEDILEELESFILEYYHGLYKDSPIMLKHLVSALKSEIEFRSLLDE